MNRSNLGLLAALAAVLAAALVACESETGPDAPPRQNGCIDLGCGPAQPAIDAGAADAG